MVSYTDLMVGKQWPSITNFKYGGAGGSIFDTNLSLLNSQLQRLRADLRSWSKIDDLWYVMDALLGWEIRRIPPPKMPINIENYQSCKKPTAFLSAR